MKQFVRIADCINIRLMRQRWIALIGAGGAAGLAKNLARCALGACDFYDFDVVAEENLSRQDHYLDAIGKPKPEAVAAELRRINPKMIVRCFNRDITTMTEEEQQQAFAKVDLIINATDSFKAQAFGNQLALKFNIPSIWVGLYAKGAAGEIIFWHPGLWSCLRCLCPKRYTAHEQAMAEGRSLDPSSESCTIFDVTLLDAIAGQFAVGLLTRGSNDRHGCLIEQLGDRNFIQVQLDPTWALNGRNPIRQRLGVEADNTAFFSWNAIALNDPDRGQLYCPDCERLRGHSFVAQADGSVRRVVPSSLPAIADLNQSFRGGHHAS